MSSSDYLVYNSKEHISSQLIVESRDTVTKPLCATKVTKYKKLKVGDVFFCISLNHMVLHRADSYGTLRRPSNIRFEKKVYSVETCKVVEVRRKHHEFHTLEELIELVSEVYKSQKRESKIK